jgi:hypothetical protein
MPNTKHTLPLRYIGSGIGLICVLIVGLVAIGRSSLNQLACEGQLINTRLYPTSAQQIWGDQVLGQSFVAPRAGFNRIDLLFRTYQRQNTNDVTLSLLELKTGAKPPQDSSPILNITFNAADVQDQTWRTFSFPPRPGSAGQAYFIRLQSTQSISGNAITVGGTEHDVYAAGSAYLGVIPVRADMAFRTCYQMTSLEKLQLFSEQLTRNRPAIWGIVSFYALGLVVYAGLVIGLFWCLGKLVLLTGSRR